MYFNFIILVIICGENNIFKFFLLDILSFLNSHSLFLLISFNPDFEIAPSTTKTSVKLFQT